MLGTKEGSIPIGAGKQELLGSSNKEQRITMFTETISVDVY